MFRRVISGLRLVAINLLVLVTILILLEGLAGYRRFIAAVLDVSFPESIHTRYDAELGWVHIPGVRLPDFYGPGRTMTINSQGYREVREIDPRVSPSRRRAICSGDSFTLGHGVGDAETWCHGLMTLDPRLETVNMGQSAYGVDQVYLWYKRDGGRLEHQLQVFAFILEDFNRASSAVTQFPKPLLVAEDGTLVVTGTPVPGPRRYWLRRLGEEIEYLRSAALVRRIGRWIRPGTIRRHASIDETRAMVTLLLEDLQRLNRERSSTLVLVHLPSEFMREDPHGWLPFVDQQARRLGIPYIDLLDAFDSLPEPELQRMFIADGAPVERTAGHYTADGHAFVARLLTERLKALAPAE